MIISDVNGLRDACESNLQANNTKILISVKKGAVTYDINDYILGDCEPLTTINSTLKAKYFTKRHKEIKRKFATYLLINANLWSNLRELIVHEKKALEAFQNKKGHNKKQQRAYHTALANVKTKICSLADNPNFQNFDEQSARVSYKILSILSVTNMNTIMGFATTSLKYLENIASTNFTSAHGLSIKNARTPAHFTFEKVNDILLVTCFQAVNFINAKDMNQAAPLTIPGFAESSIKIDLKQFQEPKENYLGEITYGLLGFFTGLAKNINLKAAFINPYDDLYINEDSRIYFSFNATSSNKCDSAQQREDSRLWAILLQAKRVYELKSGSLRQCINYDYLRKLTQNYTSESQYKADNPEPKYMIDHFFEKPNYSKPYRLISKSYMVISNVFSAIWSFVSSIFSVMAKVVSFITYPIRALFSRLWSLPSHFSSRIKPASSSSFKQHTETKKESSSFVASTFNKLLEFKS